MAKDLVCGMEVEEEKAAAKTEYQGKTYHFCAEACKQKFDATPEEFVKKEENKGPGCCH